MNSVAAKRRLKGRAARMQRRNAGPKYHGVWRMLAERGIDPRGAGKASPDELAEVWRDLDLVGRSKAVGYLPRETIRKFCRKTVDEAVEALSARGLGVLALTENDCAVGSGAVYAFDRKMAQTIIARHEEMLARKNWPADIDPLMKIISKAWLNSDDPAMPLIRELYNDA
jgi:hypothetical protein